MDKYINQQHTAIITERLSGSVERVTFHNEENGFCVLRVKVKGHRDLVTVIGSAASITPGEYIECEGHWFNDKKHGLQFKSNHLAVIPPATLDGIEKYLGSGMVKGIGPHFANKLVRAFGETVFDVIEKTPEKLLQLEGIGKKRKQRITTAWSEQKVIREIMVFLQSHGVGTARAVRIYKTYGDNAINCVRENPYRLALDIYGIGFKTADALAMRLGIASDSLMRAQAGVRYALQEFCDRGHCAAEYKKLIQTSATLLGISEHTIEQALLNEIRAENLMADNINNMPCVFLRSIYNAEVSVAKHLARIHTNTLPWGYIDSEKAIPWVEQKTQLQLSPSQQQAIETVLTNKVAIITGGPGVGKTTVVNSIINIIRAKRLRISLCAPTGRAAKRLSETTGIAAKTVHRLLEYTPRSLTFKYNHENPLPTDVVIVDETSMLDISLMNQLIKAVPDEAALLLVGDVDQLPSVGPGAVLADLINANIIATIQLTEIFRQAASSKIIINAHRINDGQLPLENETNSDFYTIYADTPEEIYDKLLFVVTQRIPQHLQCDPIQDIQVLTPMNRGGLGARSLNLALQGVLNSHAVPKLNRYGWSFAPGDKVIQNVNNYDKDIFNGDIGRIQKIDLEESNVIIQFDSRQVIYDFSELDEVSLAYATSIHKSQGSEYPVIVIPLATQHFTLLARNLLYTGVTRGKRFVVLIAQKKAAAIAIKNNTAHARLTKLSERLVKIL